MLYKANYNYAQFENANASVQKRQASNIDLFPIAIHLQ